LRVARRTSASGGSWKPSVITCPLAAMFLPGGAGRKGDAMPSRQLSNLGTDGHQRFSVCESGATPFSPAIALVLAAHGRGRPVDRLERPSKTFAFLRGAAAARSSEVRRLHRHEPEHLETGA